MKEKLVSHLVFSQWNFLLNTDSPDNLTTGSHKKVWWKCEKGHEWDEPVYKRVAAAHPCPVCLNKRIIVGVNDTATLYPELVSQWSLKNSFSLETVPPGSAKKGFWVCDKGHEWETSIRSRTTRNSKCLVCSGQRTLTGFNDLVTVLPKLALEYHPTRNALKPANMIHFGSGLLVWWQCDKGHEWEATVDDRSKKKRGCPFCSGRNVLSGVTDLVSTHPAIASEWDYRKNILVPSDVSSGSDKKIWWVCSIGHSSWLATVSNRKAGKGCPECSLKNFTSKPEVVLKTFLEQFFDFVISRDRKVLKGGGELDIYIPEKKIAIEYNGLYWHSEKFKTKTYHHDKWLACKKQDIQLIQVWEDDWNRNPELVKRMLIQKLGVSNDSKIYARNTVIQEILGKTAQSFLTQNHIQGFASGSYYLGLFDKRDIGNLIAVLVLKKEAGTDGKTLNIIRYATSQNVVGGFTKLLSHAERSYEPNRFITFSDNTVSDGGLYKNNGFLSDKTITPDYTYLVKGERKHKFNYRLKRFRQDPDLRYEPGLTERELATLNGLFRIWDAGKMRWFKEV